MSAALGAKQDKLFALLAELGEAVVAYSGGADSAYLAWAAQRVLGDRALAVTADSASLPASHKRDAEAFARQFGIRHEYVTTSELANPDYVRNDGARCFHCKDELFTRLEQVCGRLGWRNVLYGINLDDTRDYRPGHEAARRHDVRAPLLDAELTKAEIRKLSRQAGLPTWDRPAAACLSSRIPYGTAVTPERLRQVEQGEEALHQLGFKVCRVRHHGELARLEFGQDELPRALDPAFAARFSEIFRALGFRYVTLDLDGYRQGSLNAALTTGGERVFPILPSS